MPALNLDFTTWTLFVEGDLYVYPTAKECQSDVDSLYFDGHPCAPFAVWISNPVEGWCRDVTSDFEPQKDDDDWEAEDRAYWAHSKWMKDMRTVG